MTNETAVGGQQTDDVEAIYARFTGPHPVLVVISGPVSYTHLTLPTSDLV